MLKIVLIGPESTGKTTLARQLAKHYKTIWIEEYARLYIDNLERPYIYEDLEFIAKGQIKLEENSIKQANEILICDTDLIVIKIWSLFKYQTCSKWIIDTIQERSYDLYILCGIDIPWTYDAQREHPNARQELYDIYKKELEELGKRFIEVKGNASERLLKATTLIDTLMNLS